MPQCSCQERTDRDRQALRCFSLLGVRLPRRRLISWGRGCAGWDRKPGDCSGKVFALQGRSGKCPNPPSHNSSGSSSLSLPAHGSAAWSWLCRELLLCPHVSSLSVLTDPIPLAVFSALPHSHLLAARHCPGASLYVQGLRRNSGKSSLELGSECLLQSGDINFHLPLPTHPPKRRKLKAPTPSI